MKWIRRVMEPTKVNRNPPLLSVIIPVFNEAATLEELLRQVIAVPIDKQVLIVDDGSTDGTPALIERLEGAYDVDVLRHVENRGKGAAVRTGLCYAAGRFTIVQDGDLELSPADYPALLEPLLQGRADCVVGSRFVRSRTQTLPQLGIVVLNQVVRILYNVRLTDEACCFKVLSTSLLRRMELECERFEFCPEVIAKASRLGLRITEVAVSYSPRSRAEGKKLRYRDGFQALRTLWKWRSWVPRPVDHDPGTKLPSKEDTVRIVVEASP